MTCISFFCQKNLCLANNGNPFLQTIDKNIKWAEAWLIVQPKSEPKFDMHHFSLWLLILRSYQIASQTSSFSTIVILSESKTYRPMRKNSKSQNSVTPHCICINVYRFWLQEKFFFGTSFNSLTVWIVAKF